MSTRPVRRRLLLPVLALTAALGGAVPCAAQDATPGADDGAFDGILRALDLKARRVPPADFVKASRPPEDQLQYIPVGKTHPVRTDKPMSAAEVAAMTDSLDAKRMAVQRKAGVKPVPVPMKEAKGVAAPASAAKRAPAKPASRVP